MRRVGARFAYTVHRAVRAERGRAGLTQAELADRLGWSRSKVQMIETGERALALGELPDVCRALGVTLRQLLAAADPADLDALGL